MAEVNEQSPAPTTQAATTTTPEDNGSMGGFDPSKIKSAGKSSIGRLDTNGAEQSPQQNSQQQQSPAPDNGAAATTAAATTAAATTAAATTAAAEIKLPEVSDEQLRELLKGKGIDFEGDFEAMKSKLTVAPAPVELTAEQKAEAEVKLEQRMLNKWMADGGKAEDFVALKQILAADKEQLALAARINELTAKGFSAEDATKILNHRYYKETDPETLVKEEDESDDDFKKRKEFVTKVANYGKEKFESRSSTIRKDAEDRLNAIREAITNEDAAIAAEAKFSSTVEEFSKTIPRKLTFELGEVEGKKLAPVVYDVKDSDVAAVTDMLKDPAKRKQILFNEDGKLDLKKAFDLLLKNQVYESSIIASYNEGGNRQVEEIKKVFPGSPFELGVGGNSVKRAESGKIVKAGKPTVVPQNR